jgi:predicted dehydrogenase
MRTIAVVGTGFIGSVHARNVARHPGARLVAVYDANFESATRSAKETALVDPAIGEAGDVDTSIVLLRMASGALCQIDSSRRTAYGYDERVEVFGSEGMAESARQSLQGSSGSEGRSSSGLVRTYRTELLRSYRRLFAVNGERGTAESVS